MQQKGAKSAAPWQAKKKSQNQHRTKYAILSVALKPLKRGKGRKVLKMAQIEYIKHLYESEGKSLWEITQIVGKNFRTVQKYAYMDNFNPQGLPNVESDTYPILGPYIQIINAWMEQDMREPRKQQHTATRIWHGYRENTASKASMPA